MSGLAGESPTEGDLIAGAPTPARWYSSGTCSADDLAAFAQISEPWCSESRDPPYPVTDGWGIIANIAEFLEICPTDDPAYQQIRDDFTIRRNDVVVGELTCTGPVPSIPIDEWTDELVLLHGLRAMYYMDRYMSGHLPWTDDSLYDWMRSKLGGINIKGSTSYCCEMYDNEYYIVVREQDDFNRDLDRYWKNLTGNIGLYAHETRHLDGYPHFSCCGITNGCDEDFFVDDLTCYGVQWWLHHLWLHGGINVGVGCLDPSDISDIGSGHVGSLNIQFRYRFCYTLPPEVSLPANPGGECGVPMFKDGFESGDTSVWTAAAP